MPARGTSRARRDSALEKRLPPLRPFWSPQEKVSLCWPLPFQRFARSSALAPSHALGVIVLSAQLYVRGPRLGSTISYAAAATLRSQWGAVRRQNRRQTESVQGSGR